VSSTIQDLLLLTIAIAIGFLLAVAFYESMATRDVLVARVQRMTRRLSRRRWVPAISYLVTVFIGIPILVLLWTVVLLVALLIVGSDDLLDDAGLVAVAIVGASRVLAYVREKSAHELAKAIPLALLFLLMTGASVEIDQRMAAAAERGGADITAEMLEFLVALEILLRLATDTSRVAVRAWQRRGLSDMVDEGSPPA
jgi:hypothetical protein